MGGFFAHMNFRATKEDLPEAAQHNVTTIHNPLRDEDESSVGMLTKQQQEHLGERCKMEGGAEKNCQQGVNNGGRRCW